MYHPVWGYFNLPDETRSVHDRLTMGKENRRKKELMRIDRQIELLEGMSLSRSECSTNPNNKTFEQASKEFSDAISAFIKEFKKGLRGCEK